MSEDEKVSIDPNALADALSQMARELAALPPHDRTSSLVQANTKKGREAALLLKRTYRVERGKCVLLPPDEQNPISAQEVPYAELPAPRVSPIIAADDSMFTKPLTDVVIQGSAYAYDAKTTKTTVSVRFGKTLREIVAYGRRLGDFDGAMRPRFSDPEPFDDIPIRWDYAYGGVDMVAWSRYGIPGLKHVQPRPEWDADTATPYHYPRNPCGCGFLIDLDEESFRGALIPHLEHPFEPLSPQRMAIGATNQWTRAPLPAAWDFQPIEFFPRCAYLGLPPTPAKDSPPPAEIEKGWATKDILSITPIMHLKDPTDVRRELGQVAAPGMTVLSLAPDERFELRNMHPNKPLMSIDLPGEVPQVFFELRPGEVLIGEPRIDTAVLRVDLDEVEILWSARIVVPDWLSDEELQTVRRVVQWQRPREGG